MIDPVKLAVLLELCRTGRPAVAAYWQVTWNPDDVNETRYYADKVYNEISPFVGIGVSIEARLLENIYDTGTFQINPDLRTETIPLNFDDIDEVIKGRFQQFKSGVRCELFYYWPDVDLTVSMWKGQLQAPLNSNRKTQNAVATNGYRSRALLLPGRNMRQECGRRVFGIKLDTEGRQSALCHYCPAEGNGVNDPSTGVPFISCEGGIDDCNKRFNTTDGRFHGGFNTNATATVLDQNTGFTATSKGNASAVKIPIRVLAGEPWVKNLQLLDWFRQPASNPNDGFIHTIWVIGEGPIESISNFQINEIITAHSNQQHRLGQRGQPRSGYQGHTFNYSHTAHVYASYGRVNVVNYSPSNMSALCRTKGFNQVCVYTDDSPLTKTRIWTDNRAWWILEAHKNQKWGLGFAESEFTIADWMSAATWCDITVSTTFIGADDISGSETRTYSSRRSAFTAILEGRPSSDQITDMCLPGGLSVPFQHEGKYTIAQLRAATSGELTNARVFTDTGPDRNIVVENSVSLINPSFVPDDKLVNTIEVRFEEASNKGTERPIRLWDDEQKQRAGRILGFDTGYYSEIPRAFSALGITTLAEALRFARRMLWFGEFDEGGIQNNCSVTITCDLEQILGLKRYDIIKPVSDVLTGITIGLGDYVEPLEYVRILDINSIGNGRVQLTTQAYNHSAYSAFEVDAAGVSVSTRGAVVIGAGSFEADGSYEYVGQVNSKPSYLFGTNEIKWSSSKWRLYVNGVQLYESSSAVAFPWLAAWSVTAPGLSPAPFVFQGEPPDPGSEEVTIDPPTYNDTTGILSVTIN